MSDPLLDKLQNGTCPFTGQRYDCARCELEPENHPILSDEPGWSIVHCYFGITRFATGQTTKREMRRIAKGFTVQNGLNPDPEYLLEYFRELYKYGVEVIPMCNCERFCFKHGCRGGDK